LNILVTGCNSFIAKEIAHYFKDKKYNLILTNRKTLDVSKPTMVDQFFNENKIDFVIHTAIAGGKRLHKEGVNDLFSNLTMFENLYRNRHKFKLMVNIGSGAEFDRRYDIDLVDESKIFDCNPVDYYGLSKNLITRRCYETDNIYNLRLFGCFGAFEEEQRLIKATYNKINNGQDIIIHQDKYMDFVYVKDFCKIVEFYIENYNDDLIQDVNLSYENKTTLKNVVFLIKNLTNAKNNVILNNNIFGKPYTGNYKRLNKYNLNLSGLKKGIEECLIRWKKS